MSDAEGAPMFEPLATPQASGERPSGSSRRVKRRERLFTVGESCSFIYAVRHGFLKSCMVDTAGREQVVGFHMKGDLLGMDGLASRRHAVEAVALEDSEVQMVPLTGPAVAVELAREVARQHRVMMVLGTMTAPERLAVFLGDLSRRFAHLGYSPMEFHLRMTRADIASYLGLKLETVSRLFSEFERDGLIAVARQHVRIVDRARLERRLRATAEA